MLYDAHKKLNIRYNDLNLVQKVIKADGCYTNYRYLANGTKLEVVDNAGNGYAYHGSLVYKIAGATSDFESTQFAGGRIEASAVGGGTTYTAMNYITDHLGSTRVVVNASNGDIGERNDYYPLGMRWADNNSQFSDNRYKYNGKESQSFANIDYLDYGARMYNPEIGRWFNIDPLAEKYYSTSPYAYCLNNPIKYIDPDGRAVGDYYSSSGNKITSDGIDDNRLYLVNDWALINYERRQSRTDNDKEAIRELKKGAEEVDGIIVVTRTEEEKNYTQGEFEAIGENSTSGATLEPEGPDTTTPNKNKRIPVGTYDVDKYSSVKYSNHFILSNDDVSENRKILIHTGIGRSNSEGCILVSTYYNKGIGGEWSDSRNTGKNGQTDPSKTF